MSSPSHHVSVALLSSYRVRRVMVRKLHHRHTVLNTLIAFQSPLSHLYIISPFLINVLCMPLIHLTSITTIILNSPFLIHHPHHHLSHGVNNISDIVS